MKPSVPALINSQRRADRMRFAPDGDSLTGFGDLHPVFRRILALNGMPQDEDAEEPAPSLEELARDHLEHLQEMEDDDRRAGFEA